MNTKLSKQTEEYLLKENKRIKKNKKIFKGMAEYLTDKFTQWAILTFVEEMNNRIIVDSPTELYYMCGSTSPKNVLRYSKRTTKI